MKRILALAVFVAVSATGYVLACGPFLTELRTVETVVPPHLDQYGRGSLGVVRPHFARRYLVQAYRRFSGQPPLPNAVPSTLPIKDPGTPPTPPAEQWQQLRNSLVGEPVDPVGRGRASIPTERSIGNYESIDNCLSDAFVSAVRTLNARVAQHGRSSAPVRDWIRAQDAVFSNCSADPLALPEAAPPSADALTRADRAYQTAAAYFYAMRYDEAVQRFRAIAADSSSAWRPYGRYMAARALIRKATVPEKVTTEPLLAAEEELRRVLEDPAAASLHGSARGLLDFIAARAHPIDRLRVLTAALTGARTVTDQQLTDYQRLMDTMVGDTTRFDYAAVPNRAAIVQSADLSDWILSMQGTGGDAADRAVSRWKQSGSLPWLAAALWKVPAAHAESAALLEAAARVDRSSPAFATLSFLRVRLLAAGGQRDQARAVLATLPVARGDGVEAETLNLLSAERFMLADSMDELLASAPRAILLERVWSWSGRDLAGGALRQPIFDDDAGVVFSLRMPLARLVEAATSATLPDRLRLRVASAAFARAWMLKQDDQALAVAPVLRSLSPSLRADLERFEAAPAAEERRNAGLGLLLRTPGLRASVTGMEDDEDYAHRQLPRAFDHVFRRNWWCSFAPGGPERRPPDSEVIALLYADGAVPYPAFLSADERAENERELSAITALGTAPNYLAGEAVKWAVARPSDVDAAEALAHAVEGTRWGCTDEKTTAASRTAFQTLHRLFPKTEWALKTKYWY
jgi:hypothetical protein